MFEDVVVPAEQFEVPEGGGSSVGPVPDEVDVTPSRRAVTAGMGAMPVAGDHRPFIAAGTSRVVRPMSTGSPAGPNTIRLIVLSQQIRRMSSGVRTFAGALSVSEYRSGLEAAGFSSISLTPTHRVTDGLDSMIVRAVKP
jgi:hypothetical protein